MKIGELSKRAQNFLTHAGFDLTDDINVVQDGVRRGINNCCWTTDAPLHQAAMHGDLPLINELLDCGANVNIRCSPGGGGWNPLQYAAYYGRAAAVKLLIDRGAEDTQKITPSITLHAKNPEKCPRKATLMLWTFFEKRVLGREVDYKKTLVNLDTPRPGRANC